MTISHERLIVSVELELFGKLLLGHIKSLMMHVPLVSTSSEIRWQVIFNIDNLCHILNLSPNSLCALTVPLATWSE